MEKTEIVPNTFIPNILVSNLNQCAIVPILNLNKHEVEIETPLIELINIEQFQEINYTQINKQNPNASQTNERTTKIIQLLRVNHLTQKEKDLIINICEEFSDIFHLKGEYLTTTDIIKHSIHTKNDVPVNCKLYRFPKIHEEEVNKQIKEMLENNIIRHSKSPYSSNLWIVPKKMDSSGKQKWRLVVDYRKLNEITEGDSYPLPSIENILDHLGNAKHFTVMDLSSGFHQINMEEKDKPKTAFRTSNNQYEFNRMPFGLKCSPNTFARMMTEGAHR